MAEAVLQARGLCKSFGALKATDQVDIDLQQGEIHALIGPNGAGKSTLISILAGGIKPDAGRVCLQGRDITSLSIAARACLGLARSFQISALALELSALRNVMMATQGRGASRAAFLQPVDEDPDLINPALEALASVELEHRAHSRAAALSHGERRRLELACALALKPRLLLLDEPMAGMGSEGAEKLGVLFEQLKQDVPILLVEHDMDAVFRLADRISVLVYGQIIKCGTADEVRSDPDVQEAYLGPQI